MLEFLRRFYGSLFGKIVTIIVGFLFIVGFSFLPYIMGGRGAVSPQNVAMVDGQPVTVSAFYRYYGNLENYYRESYGKVLNSTIKKYIAEKTLSSLIADKVLENRINDFGVGVSKRYLANKIAGIYTFQKNGNFSNKVFTSVLAQNHMTPAIFEKHYKNDINRHFQRAIIESSFSFNKQQIADNYKIQNKSVAFEAAIFKTKNSAYKFIKKIVLSNSGFKKLGMQLKAKIVDFPSQTNAQLISSNKFKKYNFNAAVLKAASSGIQGKVSLVPIAIKSGFAVLKIKSVHFSAFKLAAHKKFSVYRNYMFEKQTEFLDYYVKYLESKSQIKLNNQLINKIRQRV
ncbi:MAG: SurA N-terminal domain-containing protein [bacterium]